MSRIRVWGTIFLLAAFALVLGAQTPETANIQGHITDQAGAAVAGAQVSVTNSVTGEQRMATTDSGGNYAIANLPIAGTYQLTVTKSGFATAQTKAITLVGGQTALIDSQLNVSAATSTVTVTGTVGEVQADEPQLGNYIPSTEISNLPLYDNQITYVPLLNSANRPAINMGDQFMDEDLITTNSGGRRQTSYIVDGVQANDDWGRQTIFSNLPAPTVQEMTVLESPFSAQYGWTGGGLVNIVSKSGTDQLHGELYDMVRPQGTEAGLSGFTSTNATSGNDLAYDKMNQVGWDIGGPIGAHTQFFVGGEDTKRERGSPVISPIEPEIFEGVYGDGLMYARLDHQFSANNDLFFRADVDRYYDTNPLIGAVGGNTLPSVQRIFRRYTYTGELGDTWALTPNVVNSIHLQYQLADPITEFDPVDYSTAYTVQLAIPNVFTTAPTFTEGTSSSAKLTNHQYEPNDTVTWVKGRHTLQIGADWIFGRDGGNSKESGGPSYLGTFTFNPCTGPTVLYCETTYIQTYANASSFTQSFGNANYMVSDTMFDAFLQDDFHVNSRLTLNLGARYDRQTFTDSKKNWSPRLGFDYRLGSKGTTVLRGGYGIFFSQLPDNMEANYAIQDPSSGVFTFTATAGHPGFPSTLNPWPSEAALLAAVPTAVTVPSSIYIRPGRAAYYNQFFPTSVLKNYQTGLWSPYTQEWTLGLEHRFGSDWVASADYVGSHTINIDRPLDVNSPPPFVRTAQDQYRGAALNSAGVEACLPNAAAGNTATTSLTNCAANVANIERPLYQYDTANGLPVRYQSIISDVNDGMALYDALEINVSHHLTHRLLGTASYTWSHTIDNVDWDATAQSPNDPNFVGPLENGNALYDQRHRFVLSAFYTLPAAVNIGGIATLASGLPYNITTGTVNGGDSGGETDRPVINGVVIGRNTGTGTPIYSVDPFVERPFHLTDRVTLDLRAEALNVLNHANFVSFNGTYGNGTTPAAGFGAPSVGAAAQLNARELQFSGRLSF